MKEVYKSVGLTFDEYVGRQIKTARTAKKIKQEDLAHKLGISKMGLSYIERGQRGLRVSLFMEIAKHLKQPINYFTGEQLNPPATQHSKKRVRKTTGVPKA